MAKPEGHIQADVQPERSTASIPRTVRTVPLPPPPEAREAEIRYSVVVANQPVREVLLAMARETRVNFDIHPGIQGTINLNAIDQTLKQILNRIAKQVDLRWEVDGGTITVMPDTPYLRTYRVDYVNMTRDVNETVGIATQVISGALAGATGGAAGNNSTLNITSVAKHHFWETLEKNLKDMLRETDKRVEIGGVASSERARNEAQSQNRAQAAGTGEASSAQGGVVLGDAVGGRGNQATQGQASRVAEFEGGLLTSQYLYREAAAVIVNSETGIITVRATSRQHERVQEFLENVAGSSKRQVLIEATIVEVALNDNYQTGVDWSALGINGLGYSFRQSFTGTNLAAAPFFSLQYNNPNAAIGGSISSTVKLLDSFGKTRVLSSPKLMVLNNQTAILKVVDNRIYFTVKADTTTNQTTSTTTFTTTQNVVPIGFIMNVTPQISDNDMVTLNVRPTVTKILDFVNDPNPSLAAAGVVSRIPQTQTREMESVLKVGSGQTAILGGLMLDSFDGKRDGLPLASRVPVLGDLVSYRNDTANKTELVIFIRPVVIRNASLDGDLAEYRRYLPGSEFFRDTRAPFPCVERSLARLEDRALDSEFPCTGMPSGKPQPVDELSRGMP